MPAMLVGVHFHFLRSIPALAFLEIGLLFATIHPKLRGPVALLGGEDSFQLCLESHNGCFWPAQCSDFCRRRPELSSPPDGWGPPMVPGTVLRIGTSAVSQITARAMFMMWSGI